MAAKIPSKAYFTVLFLKKCSMKIKKNVLVV